MMHDLNAALEELYLAANRTGTAADRESSVDALEKRARELELALQALRLKNDHMRLQVAEPWDTAFPLFEEMSRLRKFVEDYPDIHQNIYLQAAETLMECGRDGSALGLVTSLAVVRPDLERIHPLLDELGRKEGPGAGQARDLSRACRVRYLGSFGQGHMDYPFCLCMAQRHDQLYVSDVKQGRLHRYHLPGQEHTIVEGPWKSCWGMAQGLELVWVCDYLGMSVYGLDQKGRTACRVDLQELLKGRTHRVKPEFICFLDGRLFVMVSDKRVNDAEVVSFQADFPGSTLALHSDLPGELNCGGIVALGGYVYVGNHRPAALYRLDPGTGTSRVFKTLSVDRIYNLAGWGEHLFLTHDDSLSKIATDGRTVYAPYLETFTKATASCQGIALWENRGREHIFLADTFNRAIQHLEGSRTTPG
jgi:hypothetical protein